MIYNDNVEGRSLYQASAFIVGLLMMIAAMTFAYAYFIFSLSMENLFMKRAAEQMLVDTMSLIT